MHFYTIRRAGNTYCRVSVVLQQESDHLGVCVDGGEDQGSDSGAVDEVGVLAVLKKVTGHLQVVVSYGMEGGSGTYRQRSGRSRPARPWGGWRGSHPGR